MTKLVICKVQVYGFHRWKDAFERVDYLRYKHRHVFFIEVAIQVEHNNRQVEIIDTQNDIIEYLFDHYGTHESPECDFGDMSCEDIAEVLMNHFKAYSVTVTEDGFGGAKIIK